MSQRKAEYKYSKKSPMENMRGLRFPKNHFESLTITHFYQKKMPLQEIEIENIELVKLLLTLITHFYVMKIFNISS